MRWVPPDAPPTLTCNRAITETGEALAGRKQRDCDDGFRVHPGRDTGGPGVSDRTVGRRARHTHPRDGELADSNPSCSQSLSASMLHGDPKLGMTRQGGGAESQLDIARMLPAARFELTDPAESAASQAATASTSAEPASDDTRAGSKEHSDDSADAEAPSRPLQETELRGPGAHRRPQQQRSASSGPARSATTAERGEEGQQQAEADTQVCCAACPSCVTLFNATGSVPGSLHYEN